MSHAAALPTAITSSAKEKAQYPLVRGLARGLAVLEALNQSPEGCATPAELAAITGLHRTTVRRLLETLMVEGFVLRSPSHQADTYLLSIRVRQLSDGFTDDELVAALAPPVLFDLMRHVVWPSDLSTPHGPGMLIRETTHRFSPLSFHAAMAGRRLPLLTTAAGRVYMAFCEAREREALLAMLRAGVGGEQQQRLAHDDTYLRNLLARVQERGYGLNQGDMDDARKTGAIAVPVWENQRMVAAINIVYLERAVSAPEAVTRYLPHLLDAARQLEERLTATRLTQAESNRALVHLTALAAPRASGGSASVPVPVSVPASIQSFMATDFNSV